MHHVSADTHLGHINIMQYCRRPFATIQEMDDAIIANARRVVKPNHHLWILGDVAFSESSARAFFQHVPGHKHFVPGNHDTQPWMKTLGWASMREPICELRDNKKTYVLCHYPMRTWNKAHHGSIQLFGHVHDQHPGWRNCVNVGVDWWNFTPATLPQILERSESLAPAPDWGPFTPPPHLRTPKQDG